MEYGFDTDFVNFIRVKFVQSVFHSYEIILEYFSLIK